VVTKVVQVCEGAGGGCSEPGRSEAVLAYKGRPGVLRHYKGYRRTGTSSAIQPASESTAGIGVLMPAQSKITVGDNNRNHC
jgi:hypothetical protein